jgi:hypothetical protein
MFERAACRLLAVAGIVASMAVTLPSTAATADPPAALEAPVVTVVSQGFEELTVTATEGGTAPVTEFVVTYGRVDNGLLGTDNIFLPAGSRSGSDRLTPLDDGVAYTLTVVAVDTATDGSATTSPSSQPIIVTPITGPSQARHVHNSYANGLARVWWDRPRHDGGSPVTHYNVTLGCGPRAQRRQTLPESSRVAVFRGIRPGKICPVKVRAFNKYVGGFVGNDASMFTDLGLVTSLSRTGHARWRFVTAGHQHSLGGPRLAAAPSVTVDRHGNYYFLGATAAGHVYDRTLSRPWHRLVTPPCFRPALARVPPAYFDIGCRSSRGTFMYSDTSTVSRGRLVPPGILPWTDTGRHIIGGVSAAQESLSGEFVVRTAARDAAGHDVSYFDSLSNRWHPVRLSCDATPAVSGRADDFSATFGCRHSRRSVQWETTGGFPGTHVHTARTPVPVTGAVGIASFLQSLSIQVAVTGVDHKVHLLNAEQRLWSTVGHAASPSLVLYAYSGSRDFSHIVTTGG